MNNKIQILILLLILSLPFALSSQTRKPIPAGRHEALSGIKSSAEAVQVKDTGAELDKNLIIWNEVASFYSLQNKKNAKVFFSGNLTNELIPIQYKNSFFVVQNSSQRPDILFSDDIKRDQSVIAKLVSGSLIAIYEMYDLQEFKNKNKNLELITFISDKSVNYSLFKVR